MPYYRVIDIYRFINLLVTVNKMTYWAFFHIILIPYVIVPTYQRFGLGRLLANGLHLITPVTILLNGFIFFMRTENTDYLFMPKFLLAAMVSNFGIIPFFTGIKILDSHQIWLCIIVFGEYTLYDMRKTFMGRSARRNFLLEHPVRIIVTILCFLCHLALQFMSE